MPAVDKTVRYVGSLVSVKSAIHTVPVRSSTKKWIFFFDGYGDHRDLHSFPTRRSSDRRGAHGARDERRWRAVDGTLGRRGVVLPEDRKSTRLNSSHLVNSYAVFCLK